MSKQNSRQYLSFDYNLWTQLPIQRKPKQDVVRRVLISGPKEKTQTAPKNEPPKAPSPPKTNIVTEEITTPTSSSSRKTKITSA